MVKKPKPSLTGADTLQPSCVLILIRFVLAHAEEASLGPWAAGRLQGGQAEEPAVFWRRPGAGRVDAKLAGGPGCSIQAPRRHVALKRRRQGRDQRLECVERHAGQSQELRGAIRHVRALSMSHEQCLLAWEAPYTLNRDNLKSMTRPGASSSRVAAAIAICTGCRT